MAIKNKTVEPFNKCSCLLVQVDYANNRNSSATEVY